MKFDTLSDNPELLDVINEIHSEPWPVFLSEDEVVKKCWRRLYDMYPQYQLLFREQTDYVGLANSFPMVSMKNYMKWEKSGYPFDPWLRIHVKGGGSIIKEANPSMIVKGIVAEWEDWTGMYFGDSGDYIVEGALNPVRIDLKNDSGEYIEPNVWVLHEPYGGKAGGADS